MELELKNIAPYLPYNIAIEPIYKSTSHGGFHYRALDVDVLCNYGFEEIKPILKPLNSITREMLSNDIFWGYQDYLTIEQQSWIEKIGLEAYILKLPFAIVSFLIENHFDIFGLIDNYLAIDLNLTNH